MDSEKIGLFIAKVRKEKNMTQKELAEKLNVTIQAISKWERGLGIPDITLFKPLAKIFGISVIELMEGERIKNDNINKVDVDKTIINTLKYSQKEKNRIKKIAFFVILIIILLSGTAVTYSIIKTNSQSSINHGSLKEKMGILEKDDGWVYTLIGSLVNNKIRYSFDGINLKYLFLEGERNPQYLADKSYQEVVAISKFFTNKQFTNKISLNDLNDLNTTLVNKKDLVDIFNRTITSKFNSNWGRYMSFGNYLAEEYEFGNDYKWTLGCVIDYGNIKICDIELIYNSGEHLSDLVKNNKATKNQIELNQNIIEIEKFIIKNKFFDMPTTLKEVEPFKTLKIKLLHELDPNFK